MKPLRMGITLRTALLSWLVTLTTLLVFMVAIVPMQKRTFLENLDSKAHGIAVSLRDVAAGAVINEDYSTVVDHCRELLSGDQSLAYVVLTKNDGFSLVQDRHGWRSETKAPREWRPTERVASGGIRFVEKFNQRVFHYSQPFDYSGIQWGWIHVGLSLDAYDESVTKLSRRVLVLGIICVAVSLLASVVYARRLVQPILSVQKTVQHVAGGNLAARVETGRSDELGNLAVSINSMTEALLRRDRILASVQFAAQQFLATSDWRTVIDDVLAQLGRAAGVHRIQLFSFEKSPTGRIRFITNYHWLAAGGPPSLRTALPSLESLDDYPTFRLWRDALQRDEIVTAVVRDLPSPAREFLSRPGIKSLIILRVRVEGQWWGNLCLDDCEQERQWTAAERASIRAAADMLGAAIARQRIQDALVEAKNTLEQRVADRTRDLREEAAAKDRAHAELARTQQRLLELSREAGRAEVATAVLHNVGNVLNSVNVSATLIGERLTASEIPVLVKMVNLLHEHAGNLAPYLASDPRGRLLPELLAEVAKQLASEQREMLSEQEQLSRNLEHIKHIVATQQDYARVSGVLETLSIAEIVNEALQINAAALTNQHVQVERDYCAAPFVTVDKHRVLQILVNLIRNAQYALEESGQTDRKLTLTIRRGSDRMVQVSVVDNGIGIPPENLTRIFSHGFTTRRDGHGFGLHSGANAAREMGGRLFAFSAGSGTGATFTLELPIAAEPVET